MKNASVALLGALCLVACSKEPRPAENVPGVTTTRSATEQPTVSVEEVRTVLLEKRPGSAESINALMIRNDGGIVTLRGSVEDESTHSDLVNRVRAMPNVRGVRDEIHVSKQHERSSTTTTTGAPAPGQHEKGEHEKGEHEKAASSKSDSVRKSMEKARPKSEAVIHGLMITDDGQIVTISGTVPDAETHQALLKAAKDTPGVKNIHDDMKVQKK
jgi:osmotically-inducible protein OsmY